MSGISGALSASLNYFWPVLVVLMIGFGYMIHDDPLSMIVVKVGAMLSMLATIRWHYRYLPETRDPEIPKVEDPETW